MPGELVRYNAMCQAIASAYEVDEVKDIRDRAIALEHYSRLAPTSRPSGSAAKFDCARAESRPVTGEDGEGEGRA